MSVPWYILWPLRKAAIIPVVVLTVGVTGASFGSFDLARRGLGAFMPSAKKERKLTRVVAGGAAVTAMGAAVVVREALFPPHVPAPPSLGLSGSLPLAQLIRNATATALHVVVNYPFSHRFTTSFVAGTSGGLVYAVAAYLYNRDRIEAEAAKRGSEARLHTAVVKPAIAAAAVLHADSTSFEEEAVSHEDKSFSDEGAVSVVAATVAVAPSPEQHEYRSVPHAGGGHVDALDILGLRAPPPLRRAAVEEDPAAHEEREYNAHDRDYASPYAKGGKGDDFLESYRDRYGGTGARDAAKVLSSEEGGHSASWDPFDKGRRSIDYEESPQGR